MSYVTRLEFSYAKIILNHAAMALSKWGKDGYPLVLSALEEVSKSLDRILEKVSPAPLPKETNTNWEIYTQEIQIPKLYADIPEHTIQFTPQDYVNEIMSKFQAGKTNIFEQEYTCNFVLDAVLP